MKVLLTGNAGFVGSTIADHLIAAGHEVTGCDDFSTGAEANVNPAMRITLKCKVSDFIGIKADTFDAVIHAAAYADLRHNWDDAEERKRLYDNNVGETMALLERWPAGKPFLFLSTASVYGTSKGLPVWECDALPSTCESPYAASKFACEAMIAAYAFAKKFPYKIGRLVNVVGARTKHGVLGDFVRMHQRDGKIHAADNGKQRKSWVHVADVADAFVRMLDPDVPSGIYTVTSLERISWWDAVDIMKVPRESVTFEDRPGGAIGDPINLDCDNVKLAPYYKPHRKVEDGIREALTHLGWKL